MIKIEPQGNGTVKIICLGDGIRRRVKVTKTSGGVQAYMYALDVGVSVLPLSEGRGNYQIEVYEPLPGMAYKRVCAKSVRNESDGRSVFLCPNVTVNYTPDSVCAKAAKTLVDGSLSRSETIERIAEHIKSKLSYDYARAEIVKQNAYNGYTPDADAVYANGKGICYDYAVLFAAMLRSVGIPCKVVTGRVKKGALYHAWNEAYAGGKWTRYDLTFEDTGGGNYDDYRAEKYF